MPAADLGEWCGGLFRRRCVGAAWSAPVVVAELHRGPGGPRDIRGRQRPNL